MKKFIPLGLIIILVILIGGIFYYWWQNQADIRELNKTLPEGIKVEKNLFSREYKIINKLDAYEFNLPKNWTGIQGIDYYKSDENSNRMVVYSPSTMTNPESIMFDKYIDAKVTGDLESSVVNLMRTLLAKITNDITTNIEERLAWFEITTEQIGNYEVVRITDKEKAALSPILYFFQKDSAIYAIRGLSWNEESMRYILQNLR